MRDALTSSKKRHIAGMCIRSHLGMQIGQNTDFRGLQSLLNFIVSLIPYATLRHY